MSLSSPSVLHAFRFAHRAHRDQHRRDGVTPYLNHPRSVAVRLERAGHPDEVLIVGYLHDVIEDTPTAAQQLIDAGFSHDVVGAVLAITKVKGEDYTSYLERVKRNPLARAVKIYDIIDNLSDAPTERQLKKYSVALAYLV